MPKVSNVPVNLRPYVWHGVQIDYTGKQNTVGTCPFCGREKFSVLIDTGEWRCLGCNTGGGNNGKVHQGGNAYTFFRLLHELGLKQGGTKSDYKALASDRNLLSTDTLIRWGVVPSPLIPGEWLVPGYSHEGKLNQLYRYTRDIASGKRLLLATPDIGHCLFGVHLYDPKKQGVYLCEGPWDAMALEEVLSLSTREKDGRLSLTGNTSITLLASANVLAVPGCGTFHEPWLRLLGDKDVTILYDNDHPRKNPKTGAIIPPAGYEGTKRVVGMLDTAEDLPSSVSYLSWGKEGYNTELPHGYDVRDWLGDGENQDKGIRTSEPERIGLLQDLLGLVEPVPTEWVEGLSPNSSPGSVGLECKECNDWVTLTNAWRKALKWTDQLDRALSFMLAVVASTPIVGDQLWGKLIGPPSTGKSTLCEALSVCRKWIKPKSTIRGFHSGMRSAGGEDLSLMSQIKNKTLIIKDGDTFLKLPNREQVFSEARDLYDRVSRSHYRNGAGGDYTGQNTTFLLCGTPALYTADLAELGERFLICDMGSVGEDSARAILLKVAHKAYRNRSTLCNGSAESHYDADLAEAMHLTGGYVYYLRENGERLLDECEMTDKDLDTCITYGQFVADLRARPSLSQDEVVSKEFGARLVSQIVRLATCLAVAMGKKSVDSQVMSRVRQIALDTAGGKTLDICKFLYREGEDGVPSNTMATWMGMVDKECHSLLRFLSRPSINVVEYFHKEAAGYKSPTRWRLTNRMWLLYNEVMNRED